MKNTSDDPGTETADAPYDPRGVCNLILDEADRATKPLSHIVLQKLLYFAHGIYLTGRRRPLVSGYFEAWQYGPVHPAAYQAFRIAGDRPIGFRATRCNPRTGATSMVPIPGDTAIRRIVRQLVDGYGDLSPSQIIGISHLPGSPWDVIVNKAKTSVAFGMRIPDTVIQERFAHHKVSIDSALVFGDPREDAPFT